MEPVTTERSEMAVIEAGLAWQAAGERVVLATVAHTWGSSPRPAGAVMVLGESGRFLGSVSGGCIEEELITQVREHFPAGFTTIEYSSDTTRSLPCGGRLLLSLEPLAGIVDLPAMLATLRTGTAVVRELDLSAASASWREAAPGARTTLSDDRLDIVYEPVWRLQIIGAGELAQWVCRFAQLLDYAVAACDPRADYQAAWPFAALPLSTDYPDDFLGTQALNERCAVLALTHDPKVDDLAVMEALNSDAFYIGALGSRRTTASRAARLAEHFAVDAAQLARIHGPVGIDLNSRKPQEIALAVMTDITAARNAVRIGTERLG